MRYLMVNPATKRSDEYPNVLTHDELRTLNTVLDHYLVTHASNKAILLRHQITEIIT